MRYACALLLMFLCPSAFAGWYVGNGGDTIECRPSPANSLNGIYSLDYVLTLKDLSGDDGLRPVKSWEDSAARLIKVLNDKIPSLAASLSEFTRTVYSSDYSKARVWEPAPFGLLKLDDQRITSLLPENCRAANGEFLITQAVIRQFESYSGTPRGNFVYKFVPELLERLNREAPLQLSFLLVHEWLWDISSNVDRNRRINRFLHSKEFDEMSPANAESALKGMGLVIPGRQPDAFDEDLWQGYPVTEEMFFKRFEGTSRMSNLGQLRVDSRVRSVTCGEGGFDCDPGWRSLRFPNVLNDGRTRFFLSPSWRTSQQKEFPLKIVSPEIMGADGRSVLPGTGEIECRFLKNAGPQDPNLECRFMSSGLVYPLFNLSTSDTPMSSWPKMKATLTEECFRLLVSAPERNERIGPDGRISEGVDIRETALTLRLKWQP